jgi:hypothetical protein
MMMMMPVVMPRMIPHDGTAVLGAEHGGDDGG